MLKRQHLKDLVGIAQSSLLGFDRSKTRGRATQVESVVLQIMCNLVQPT
jgi:hypothetical protein